MVQIVRRGQRRVLMDVDLDATAVMPVEQTKSRIPCCSIDSPSHQPNHPDEHPKEKISSCRQEEICPTADDALRNRPSRIPCKPKAVQRNMGDDGTIHFKDGEKDNNIACAGQQENDRFMEMEGRICRLRERMDRWSSDLTQWSHQMNGRLEVRRHPSYECWVIDHVACV